MLTDSWDNHSEVMFVAKLKISRTHSAFSKTVFCCPIETIVCFINPSKHVQKRLVFVWKHLHPADHFSGSSSLHKLCLTVLKHTTFQPFCLQNGWTTSNQLWFSRKPREHIISGEFYQHLTNSLMLCLTRHLNYTRSIEVRYKNGYGF